MKTSDKIDLISVALVASQKEMGNAAKDAKNPHFKSSYASLGSMIEAVKEPLNKHGISILQSLSHDNAQAGLFLVTRLLHSSGQWIEDTAHSPLPKADPQGVGSACTYLRRYSIAAMLCITQEDDDGNAATPPKQTKEPTTSSKTNYEL